jgi:Protein of unknown function DUF262/Protein of unknown function (DUF1524)
MEQKSTGLSFDECGIAAALKQHTLTVPLNQRSYAWTEDKIKRLLDDLTKAFDADDDIYFLGTIVLTYGEKGRLEVADGQQRLATISIVIAAIRDFLDDIKDVKASHKYQGDYLLEYDPAIEDYREKLHLNFEDHEYFVKTILKPHSDREEYRGNRFTSHDRLDEAAKLAKEHIINMTAAFSQTKEKRSRIIEWLKFLNDNAKVIVITVPGKVGNAFKMFETLNARGMEASQTDILKNYLFNIAQAKIGEIHPCWISMVSTIESLGEDDLLKKYIRHFWIAHHGPTVERELGEQIEDKIRSERQALDLIRALDSFAVTYIALYTPREHPQLGDFSLATRNCIHTITRELGVEQILPLLLAIARYLPKEEAEKAFEYCLSWCVRYLIVGGGGGGVLDRVHGLRAKEISKREVKTVEELAGKMAKIVPNDEVFKAGFETANIRKTNLARYYLRAIDLHQKGEAKPQFIPNPDPTAVNAEHILPVNPNTDWKIDPDIAAAYYKRLGNIVLLSAQDNVNIGNKSFQEKKKIFKRSPYIATEWVAEYKTWEPQDIVHRQKRLAELAPEVWPI